MACERSWAGGETSLQRGLEGLNHSRGRTKRGKKLEKVPGFTGTTSSERQERQKNNH
jgi:hypothetical protein